MTNLEHMNLSGNHLPTLLSKGGESAESFISKNIDELREIFSDAGVILFRGFRNPDLESLEHVAKSLVGRTLEQTGLYTERKKASDIVYTATVRHQDERIPMHSENAYHTSFPKHILFYSKQVAHKDGRTPLASLKAVTDLIPATIKDRVRKHGVKYVRRIGVLPNQNWRATYPGYSKTELTKHLEENNTVVDWQDDILTAVCHLPGLLHHPQTGEELWFNALYSSNSHIAPTAVRQYLVREFGEHNLPTDTLFGNDEPLTHKEFLEIQHAYDSNCFSFDWKEDDLLWVDNLRFAHGRESYAGDRQVLVIQGNPISWFD